MVGAKDQLTTSSAYTRAAERKEHPSKGGVETLCVWGGGGGGGGVASKRIDRRVQGRNTP